MTSILTPLTKLLNIDVPIISAPMAFARTGLLASAVSSAGAFGFMGAGMTYPSQLDKRLTVARRIRIGERKLDIAPDQPVPIGVGFIGWILDMTESSPDPRLEAILEEKPVALWLAFGVDLGKYVAQIHTHDAVEDALRAANEWKVDIIVAQGEWNTYTYNMPVKLHMSSTLLGIEAAAMEVPGLRLYSRALPNGPLVVAAGGIDREANRRTSDSGDGWSSPWDTIPLYRRVSAQKEVIVKSGLNSTTRTLAFDEVGKTNYWPPKHNGRAIANDIIQDLNEGLNLQQRLQRFSESASKGESSRLVIWAGVGVGLTDKITSAQVQCFVSNYVLTTNQGLLIDFSQAVICSLRDETVESLKSGSKLLGL
ncbi:hypothetical protein CVT25_006223 [Psilocybe cyanescens]|uniref:Nitronate monooxygenase domain-containing protein n=1 Tax=Psilocybe cyanescens TaxID=93625 RepID=A0A409XKL6_PSICY|nr:hypothetical protein CVT25_006223 [Psilocybe cyanescens]